MTVHSITVNQAIPIKHREKTRDGVQHLEQRLTFTETIVVQHPPINFYRTRAFGVNKGLLNRTSGQDNFWTYILNGGIGVPLTAPPNNGGTINHDIDAYTDLFRNPFNTGGSYPNYNPSAGNNNSYYTDAWGYMQRIPANVLENYMRVLDLVCEDAGLFDYEPWRLYYGAGENQYTIETMQRSASLSFVGNFPVGPIYSLTTTLPENMKLTGMPFCVKDLWQQIHKRLQYYYRGIGRGDYYSSKWWGIDSVVQSAATAQEGPTQPGLETLIKRSPIRIEQYENPRTTGDTAAPSRRYKRELSRRYYADREAFDVSELGKTGHVSVVDLMQLVPNGNATKSGFATPWVFAVGQSSTYNPYVLPNSGAENYTRTETRAFPPTYPLPITLEADLDLPTSPFSDAPPATANLASSTSTSFSNFQSTIQATLGVSTTTAVNGRGQVVPFPTLIDTYSSGSVSRSLQKASGYGINLGGRTLRELTGIRPNGPSMVKVNYNLYGPFVDINGVNQGPIGFSAVLDTVRCVVKVISDKTMFPKTGGGNWTSVLSGVDLTSGIEIGSCGVGDGVMVIEPEAIESILDIRGHVLIVAFVIDDAQIDPDADTPKALLDFLTANGRNVLGLNSNNGSVLSGSANYSEAVTIKYYNPELYETFVDFNRIAEYRIGPLGIRSYGAFYEQ